MMRKAGTRGRTAIPRRPQNLSLTDVATSFGRQAIHGASCASRQPCHLHIQQTRHITRRLCLYIITICNAHVIDAERARDLCERGRLSTNRQNVTGNIVTLRSALQAVPGEVVSAISWSVGTLRDALVPARIVVAFSIGETQIRREPDTALWVSVPRARVDHVCG